MPSEYGDENGKCCWCHKGKPSHQAWDWMICHKCFTELEEEAHETRSRSRKAARRQKQHALQEP